MQSVIDKMVYSLSAPTNKNVVWVKPTGHGTFEMRIYDNNTWVSISSGGSGGSGGSGSGIAIVDSVDKLDPNAEVGSIASVATPGSIQETSVRNLYQPDASMVDQDVGILTQPELLSSVSSLKVFAPTDFTNIGFELVEASFYLVPRDFSMTNQNIAVIQVFDGGVVGMIMEGGPDITQELVLVEYDPYNDSFLVRNDQVEAFNAILANGRDWCYFGSLDTGFVITEEQFNTLDLFVNAVASAPSSTDIYVKEDKWAQLYKSDLDKLASDLDKTKTTAESKADKIAISEFDFRGVKPNTYTTFTLNRSEERFFPLKGFGDFSTYKEYIIEFKCLATPKAVIFEDPDKEGIQTIAINWANGVAPTFEAGMTYLISIVNGLGVYSMFPNS